MLQTSCQPRVLTLFVTFQHQAEYEEILAGVKGADNVKRLSSQFIARFFGLFSNLEEQSIDAMLDLCEDASVLSQ